MYFPKQCLNCNNNVLIFSDSDYYKIFYCDNKQCSYRIEVTRNYLTESFNIGMKYHIYNTCYPESLFNNKSKSTISIMHNINDNCNSYSINFKESLYFKGRTKPGISKQKIDKFFLLK